MEVIICPSPQHASNLVAELIADTIRALPAPVIGLATGRSPEGVYERLRWLHHNRALNFSHVTTFNLDEYVGIPATHPQSFRSTMQRALFDHVNIDPARTFFPDGAASDLTAACTHYEQQIRACGGIDLQLLGIGLNGHLAFNEPLSSLTSRTRVKALTPETRAQNSAGFSSPEQVPLRAATMGVATILESRWCILLALGAAKASIVQQAVEGPLRALVTASALQLHPRCTVVVDEAAAALLERQAYYRWVSAHEPEWAPYRHLFEAP